MKLSDYLDLNACVFNPVRYYDGESVFPHLDLSFVYSRLLESNSKVENGKSLFAEFVKKYYLMPLYEVDGVKRGHIAPYFVINKSENESRKRIKFFYLSYILENFLCMNTISEEKKIKLFNQNGMSKMKIYYRNLLNEQLQKYLTFKKNINNPKYIELRQNIEKDFIFYQRCLFDKLSFEDFLKIRINEFQREIKGIDKLFKLFEKKIDTDELMKCFDFDSLALIIAFSSISQCEEHLKKDNKVDYCIEFCEYYFLALKTLEEKSGTEYNHEITIDYKTGKKISSKELYLRFKKIKADHPEYVTINIDSNEFEQVFKDANKVPTDIDISTVEGAKALDDAIGTILEQKALKASWKIIPKGATKERADLIFHKIHTEITDEEAARRVEYCYKFFEPNADGSDKNARRCKIDYLYSLQGVGGFEGYTAYIYRTGKVVFEIFFEDEKTYKPVKYHATYVTDLYHFIELSKLTKQQVTEKLKKDSRLGRKYYHRHDMDKWASEIESGIGSFDYTDDVIAYINSLLKSGELTATTLSKK